MNSTQLATVVLVSLLGAGEAAAQTVAFRSGRISLTAERVSVAAILAEWGRVGRTEIRNGEKLTAGTRTFYLSELPEAQVLATLLEGVGGYVVVLKAGVVPDGESVYARILILPGAADGSRSGTVPAAPGPTILPPPAVLDAPPGSWPLPMNVEMPDPDPQPPVPPPTEKEKKEQGAWPLPMNLNPTPEPPPPPRPRSADLDEPPGWPLLMNLPQDDDPPPPAIPPPPPVDPLGWPLPMNLTAEEWAERAELAQMDSWSRELVQTPPSMRAARPEPPIVPLRGIPGTLLASEPPPARVDPIAR